MNGNPGSVGNELKHFKWWKMIDESLAAFDIIINTGIWTDFN